MNEIRIVVLFYLHFIFLTFKLYTSEVNNKVTSTLRECVPLDGGGGIGIGGGLGETHISGYDVLHSLKL